MRHIAVTVILLGLMPLALPAGAVAQVFDDGPADKEYAIPLEEARDRGGKDQSSSQRFGDGISANSADNGGAGADGAGGKGKSAKKKQSKRDAKDDAESDTLAPAPASSGSSGGGGSGTDGSAALLTGGIALAVLLIGGAVALMARRTATDDV